ncbi:hypothetical protein IWZ03DRAFT_382452 [Phyllosticta citriasiana]|uniref:Secreted protein n=1 Tax=Phyllosticta citriasiana TaxID=595635 RepID=A0ABR1KET9_9PEZI
MQIFPKFFKTALIFVIAIQRKCQSSRFQPFSTLSFPCFYASLDSHNTSASCIIKTGCDVGHQLRSSGNYGVD